MEKKSSWLPRVSATTGLLLLVVSGCLKDFDALSAEYGSGGSSGAGKGGSSGVATGGGTAASGGVNPGEAGAGGVSAEGGESGEPGTGGNGAQGGAGCMLGLTTCPNTEECTNLKVGTPDGNGVTNCGTCGTTCSLDNASSATCKAGACTPTCSTGYGDCTDSASTDNDGCETDLTTINNCGACNFACSLSGATSGECISGQCTPTCAPHYGDCNGNTGLAKDDGCERYLDALDQCTTACNGTPVACDPTKVCNDGSCVAPSGLVVLSTPAPTPDKVASRFADVFTPYPDLEGVNVTVRLYAPGATAGTVWVYLSDSAAASGSSPVVQIDLASLSQKWMDITVQAVTQGNFNAKSVKQVNVEVHFDSGAGLDPTLVYVDSVRTSNLVINDTFDASSGAFAKSSLLLIPNSTISWAASMP